jgi:hypothetical protein
LNAILNGADDGMYGLDNVMLEARGGGGGGSGGGGGGGGRGKQPAPPEQFVSPVHAEATLRGAPAPPPEDHEFDTSCDELDDEEEENRFDGALLDDDERIDAMFDGNSASARADRSARAMDQLLGSGAGGGGGGAGGGAAGDREGTGLDCFGCVYSSRADGNDKHIESNKMNNLIRIFDDLYGRIDSKVLARMCHIYFMNEIYRPLRRRGVRIRPWRTRQIHEHFTKHQLEPRVLLATQIMSYRRLSAALELTSFEETSGGSRVKPSKDNLAMKLRVDAHLLRLYALDPGKLNFHNASCKIDFETMGLLMGPYRDFS